jgi:hypothetical protein
MYGAASNAAKTQASADLRSARSLPKMTTDWNSVVISFT